MGLLDDVDRRRERRERDSENSARLAQAHAIFTSTGTGSMQHNRKIKFGTTFVEMPVVSHACYMDTEALADQLEVGEEADDLPMPLCTGIVTEWDQDDRDFYIGCWIGVAVYFASGFTGAAVIDHHFTFSGIAMKDIPTDNTDQVD